MRQPHGCQLGWRAPWPISKCDEPLTRLAPSYRCSLDWAIYDETSRCIGWHYSRSFMKTWGLADFPRGVTVVAKGTPIFPRLDMEEEVAYIKGQMEGNKPAVRMETRWSWTQTQQGLKSSSKTLTKLGVRVAEVKKFLKWKVLTGEPITASMQVMAKTVKSSQELPNTIQTGRIGRQEGPNRCQPQTTQDDEKICSQREWSLSWTWEKATTGNPSHSWWVVIRLYNRQTEVWLGRGNHHLSLQK